MLLAFFGVFNAKNVMGWNNERVSRTPNTAKKFQTISPLPWQLNRVGREKGRDAINDFNTWRESKNEFILSTRSFQSSPKGWSLQKTVRKPFIVQKMGTWYTAAIYPGRPGADGGGAYINRLSGKVGLASKPHYLYCYIIIIFRENTLVWVNPTYFLQRHNMEHFSN